MGKTLFSYIVKEIAVPFFLGMGVFTLLLVMGKFLKVADLVITKGAPMADVGRLFIYITLPFLLITIPMAFLFAVLIAFGRLSSDSEITAMKSSGISLHRMLPPVLFFALITYSATTFVSVSLLPKSNASLRKLTVDLVLSRATVTVKERVFNSVVPRLVIYVDRYDASRNAISGVLIHDERKRDNSYTIFAKSGTITTDPVNKILRLRLADGSIHQPAETSLYRILVFSTYNLDVPLNQTSNGTAKKDEDEMTSAELDAAIANPRELPKDQRKYALEYHRRVALPVACFIFAVVGLPLGIQNQRSGKAGGFALSIIILLFYYIVLTAGKTFGEKGYLPAIVAMWAPNCLFIALGAYLFKKSASEQPILFLEMMQALPQKLDNLFRKRKSR
jgi:lipopolysaccharide export system permease protein